MALYFKEEKEVKVMLFRKFIDNKIIEDEKDSNATENLRSTRIINDNSQFHCDKVVISIHNSSHSACACSITLVFLCYGSTF